MGDRLSLHRPHARLARRAPAAFRDGLGALADRFRQGRDLWRLFMGFVLIAALILRAPGADGDPRAAACWLIGPLGGALALSAGRDDHRQRRRHAAVLRPAAARLSRSARLARGARRRPRPGAGLSRRSCRRRRRRALPGDGRRRRARLWRRRSRLRRLARSRAASGRSCRPGGSMRSGSCSAASSPARSAGISTRRSSMS